MASESLPVLPCFPCPHDAACCAHGVTVADGEAELINARHPGKIYQTRWGEWRTRIRKGRCVFYQNGGCEIHKESYYPRVCQGFPWHDSETWGPYEFDRTICPEFVKRPELRSVFPFVPPPKVRKAG